MCGYSMIPKRKIIKTKNIQLSLFSKGTKRKPKYRSLTKKMLHESLSLKMFLSIPKEELTSIKQNLKKNYSNFDAKQIDASFKLINTFKSKFTTLKSTNKPLFSKYNKLISIVIKEGEIVSNKLGELKSYIDFVDNYQKKIKNTIYDANDRKDMDSARKEAMVNIPLLKNEIIDLHAKYYLKRQKLLTILQIT